MAVPKGIKSIVIAEQDILFTGGNGTLGSELKKLFPGSLFPTHKELDVINPNWNIPQIKLIVHAAAIKTPYKIDENPIPALETNIIGTSNVVRYCLEKQIRLIYISSDYVFSGEEGNYSEEDSPCPSSKYGWSKLAGECAIRMLNDYLIVRMSFFPNIFPYKAGFVDQYSSKITVSQAAKILKRLIYSDMCGVMHLGGKRKSTYEFGMLTSNKEIDKISIKDAPFQVTKDTSMNISKLEKFLDYKLEI